MVSAEAWAITKSIYSTGPTEIIGLGIFIAIIYILGLLISALFLYIGLRIVGVKPDYFRVVVVILIRDIVLAPLLLIPFFIGVIIALAIYLVVIKVMFSTTYGRAFVAWLLSWVIPLILMIILLVPIAIILSGYVHAPILWLPYY